MKESFVLFKSFYEPVKELSIEHKGLLFDAIFMYQIDKTEPEKTSPIYIPFMFFKNQFKLDEIKYQKVIDRNKENGKKGGRPKSVKNEDVTINPDKPRKPSGLIDNPDKPRKPSGLIDNPDKPKKADTVTVTVTDTVNDTVNDYKEKPKPPKKEKVFTDEIKNFTESLLNNYFNVAYVRKLKKTDLNGFYDTIEKLKRIDKFSNEEIELAVINGKNDYFWSKQFISLNKLRIKNEKQDCKHIDIFLNLKPPKPPTQATIAPPKLSDEERYSEKNMQW